ncbi:MAG: efflux RND transporter periplasmic adaptor subunit [Candidatus Eremiobacteraeota bacterium]|nr:efflux RND transporter periplasmic adaptor subunit [Candidatus Eremiobacteraeota bacterium]
MKVIPVAAAALACVFLLPACGQRQARTRPAGAAGAIPSATAHPATIRPTLTISGIIAPYQNVMLSNTLAEPTAQVNVNEGDKVHRGEVIAVLDTSDLQAQYESDMHTANSDVAKTQQTVYTAQQTIAQAPNTTSSARAALLQAQANLRQANSDLAIDTALEKQGYLSSQALRTQQTLVNVDEAAVRSNQAALNSAVVAQKTNGTLQSGLQASQIASAQQDAASARAQADQIAAQIARATIVSPIDGVVVNRNLNPGEYPGSRTIFVLQQTDPVYAELNASSADVFRVKQGAAVNLTIPGEPGSGYRGTVVGVLGQVQPGSTNFTVKVIIRGTQGRLAAGLPVTGIIALTPSSGIAIPTTAFLDDTHSSVMADKEGTATLVKVREIANDGSTSIVSGLQRGETVVANGQLGITAGQDLEDSP